MFDTLNAVLDNKAFEQSEFGDTLYKLSPTVPNVLDLFYKNLERLGYNLSELKPALEQAGNSLVISCAGSGKTTFLELKLIHDYLSGELYKTKIVQSADGQVTQKALSRVFISTFLKTGAEELKNSFDEKCTELCVQGISADSFTFSTLHAEYYSVLKDIGVKTNIISDEDRLAALKATMKTLGIRNRTRTYGEINQDEIADVDCIVGYARNRIDADRYTHPIAEDYNLTQPVLDKLLELFKKHRLASDVYDFEDLQELIYEGINTNPAFAQFISSRYDYVFIDEFQDTSQMQYEILKTYINGAKKVVAIGDDDQCIYSWRGSDINIITTRFPADYNPAVHKFTVNYRCRANILAPVIPSIKRNTNRYDKDLRAAKPGGVVVVKSACDVDDLMREVRDSAAHSYTVGILSRTNFDLLAPAILLELDGSISFSVSKSVGVSSYIPRLVFGCMKLFTRRYTEDFTFILKQFLDRGSQFEVSKIMQVLQQPGISLSTLTDEDLAYSCPKLYYTVFKPMRSEPDKKKAYVNMLNYLGTSIFSSDSPFCVRARGFCAFVIDLITNHSVLKTLPFEDIEELLTDIIPSRLNRRAYAKKSTEATIRLTTVHEAKGKEWSSVIIWNDTNGVFPAQVGKHIPTQAEFEEERRLHYIAFTRAKERLTVFTNETNQSPFLLECDFSTVDTTNIQQQSVTTIQVADKSVVPLRDSIRAHFTSCVNDSSDISVKTMNLLTFYNYDVEKAIQIVQDTYKTLVDGGQLTGANGDTSLEIQWSIECALLNIMNERYQQSSVGA